jgi:hypothetical protein
VHHLVVLAKFLHLLPLIRRKLRPERKQKTRIRLFQFSARLRYLVDLLKRCGLVGLIVTHQGFKRQFCFLQVCAQIDQLFAMLLEDTVHCFALIISQLQFLYDFRIVPPLATASGPKSPLHGRPVRTKSWAPIRRARGDRRARILGAHSSRRKKSGDSYTQT